MFPSCANNLWRMVHDRDPPGIVCHLVIAGEAYLLSAASRAYQNRVRGGRGTAQGPRRCPPEGGCGCMEKRKWRSHGRWIGRQTRATRATGESNCDGAARRQMIPDQRGTSDQECGSYGQDAPMPPRTTVHKHTSDRPCSRVQTSDSFSPLTIVVLRGPPPNRHRARREGSEASALFHLEFVSAHIRSPAPRRSHS